MWTCKKQDILKLLKTHNLLLPVNINSFFCFYFIGYYQRVPHINHGQELSHRNFSLMSESVIIVLHLDNKNHTI